MVAVPVACNDQVPPPAIQAATTNNRDDMVKTETRTVSGNDKNEKHINTKNMPMKKKKNRKNMRKIRIETIIITKRTRKAKAKNTKKIRIENEIGHRRFSTSMHQSSISISMLMSNISISMLSFAQVECYDVSVKSLYGFVLASKYYYGPVLL